MVQLIDTKQGSLERLQQEPGINYHEVFAPVARLKSVRFMVAQNNQKIHQIDV